MRLMVTLHIFEYTYGGYMKSGFTHNEKVSNAILTSVQYGTLLSFLYLSPKVATGVVWLSIEIAGIILAFWAIIVMQTKSRVSIAPLPREGAQLLEKGPYRVIRHPMYTSLIVMFIPLIVTHYNQTRLILLLVMYANLWVKLLFEEKILASHFEGYSNYMLRTWRIIPWVL